MAAIVRQAREDDLDGVLALYRHLHPDEPLPDRPAAERAWSAILVGGTTKQIVVDRAGILISCCTLAIVPNLSRNARPYAVIENVVTLPDYRQQGYGTQGLKAAVDLAWQSDCYKVLLATGSRRETTLRFYENAGFEKGGKTYFEIRRP